MQANNSSVNTDSSFFQCYICFSTVKKPRMCPSCSKLACHSCLRSWIQDRRPECPHCRTSLPLTSFADCQRFVNDVKHLISSMDKNQRLKQKCSQHNIEMQYYCSDCNEAICSDCGMFGSKHRGHAITHLNKVYQQNKNKILNELARFDNKIETYRKNGYFIKLEMQKLLMQMNQKKSFIEEYFVNTIERLQEEFKDKQEKISERYEANSREVQFLETFRDNICGELEGQTEKELITKSDEFIRCIHSLCDRNPEFEQEQQIFDTIHEIVPKYKTFTYILKDYHALPQTITYSDAYPINGIEWRLKIYPKGNGVAKDTHVSVFLEMSKAYVNENKYQYKIELINHLNVKESVLREYSSKFDIGECWGYNQFICINELDNGFLTAQGALHFVVSVRNPSYRSLVRDQQRYIDFLQNRIVSNEVPLISSIKKQEKMNELKNEVAGRKKNIKQFFNQESEVKKEQEQKSVISMLEFLNVDELEREEQNRSHIDNDS